MNSTSQKLEVSGAHADATEIPVQMADRTRTAVRVWLVDDNAKFRTLVAETLGRGHGIECARQFAGPDALLSELASKPGPDVILLDVEMGDQNGLDAVRPIKSLTRSTRVLMFTTFYDPESRERALNDGASDYLLKTGPLANLLACIHRPAEVTPILPRRPKPTLSSRSGAHRVSAAAGPPVGSSPRALVRALKILRSFWN
jgi:DNA-binding NarL/FixJ family response regulator